MSVGHVARTFEESGIATTAVYVSAFGHYAAAMRLPRVVVTPFPMGRPLGPPGDTATQDLVLRAALGLIDTAAVGGTISEVALPYRPGTE